MSAFMIPATMLAALTLLGILGIGYEIENPFNDDYNDLPLDDFCKVIQAEVDSMISTRAPVPADWVYDDNNYPIPGSNLSAKQLSKLTLEQVHELMAADTPRYSLDEQTQARKSVQFQYSRPVPANAGFEKAN
jgi:putative membrane protein